MKKSLGLGMIALAMAGGFGTSGVQSVVEVAQKVEESKVQENRGSENRQSENRNVSAEQTQKIAAAKNYTREKPFVYQSNPGTPPKEYGMHFVKRGTHKRTNI